MLEGSLDASEIKDKNFIENWYELWTPLEIFRADSSEKTDNLFILEKLRQLKKFLQKALMEN